MFHSGTIQSGLINEVFWFRRKIVEMQVDEVECVFLLFKVLNFLKHFKTF